MIIGAKFSTSFSGCKDTFDGEILSIDNDIINSDRQYVIKITNVIRYDIYGNKYQSQDSIIEVERNWFDFELTGRKIQWKNL